ncbi:MAG: exopolysaccharide production protein ExoQ [Acidobacteriaceae bacterium]|nr:exopolysaccharide production protein ExoQ [Acidobacteriaceae bacterium]
MNPLIATFICACGIAGLFYFDRDKRARTSRALWLPVIYFWIIGSRSVATWLNVQSSDTNVQLQGSPVDAAIFGMLLIAAIGVLIYRKNKTGILLTANWPILIYFFYCLISVVWSYHPDISFKRWIKAISDLAMGMIVVTDGQPIVAFKRLISRVGFILLPASVLLIKYTDLGRGYTPDGAPENIGVTTNKNTLGVVLLVIGLGTLWHIITLVRAKGRADRRRHLIAQGVLIVFGIVLFKMANSATSTACFTLGGGLILATNHRAIRARPARVQVLCFALVLVGALTFFFAGHSDVANALGRSSNLSGRTEIWAALIPSASNPILGAGFEDFWISPDAQRFWRTLSHLGWWHPEILVPEAHNGYIEIYLNLGWVGLCLVSIILISGYRRAVAAFRMNPSVGSLMLAYVIVSAVYSITEAGFRSLDPIWSFLLLAIITSTGITTGIVREPLARERLNSRGSSSIASAETSWAYPRFRTQARKSSSEFVRWSSVAAWSASRPEKS